VLYHGTATRFVESILSEGLKPQVRQQVHLSADEATAWRVGQRHGKPAILKVEALRMHAKGFKFFLADNGVWLTDQVPPEFLAL
jgi:putative RNA 2'-phosphotransferase